VKHAKLRSPVLVAIGIVTGVVVARAAVPASATALVYSGFLENNGAPVDGSENIGLVFHKSQADANDTLCEVASGAVNVAKGRFSIPIDGACTASIAQQGDVFVEVDVAGAPLGTRTKIGAVPFAEEASHAASADSATSATNASHASSADTATTCATANAVAANAIGGAQVADGSLSGADFANASIGAGKLASDRFADLDISATPPPGFDDGGFGAACVNNADFVDCQVAAHRWCQNAGFRTGFATMEAAPGIKAAICLQ
jgi:hypothetical protein